MENITKKNLKAAVRTEGIKVKVHVIDQSDTCNPIQLVRKEVHFRTTHCGDFGAPFACCIGLSIRRFQPIRIVVPFSTLLLQAFCIFGGPKMQKAWFVVVWGYHGNSTLHSPCWLCMLSAGWQRLCFTTRSTSRRRRRARCADVVHRFRTAASGHLSRLSFTW